MSGQVPTDSLRTRRHIEEGDCMQLKSNMPLAVGVGAFWGLYEGLCAAFDPMTAFALALVALVVLKNL